MLPGGAIGSLLIVAACFGAAAYCFSRVSWPFAPSFPQVLWLIAGVIFLLVGVVIGALLIAARLQ